MNNYFEVVCFNDDCQSVVPVLDEEQPFRHHMLLSQPPEHTACPVCNKRSLGVYRPYPAKGPLHPRFALGEISITEGVRQLLGDNVGLIMFDLLGRHGRGDWGDLDDQDKHVNDQAICDAVDTGPPALVLDRSRTLSAYEVGDGKLWLITEAGRHATTLLTPGEY